MWRSADITKTKKLFLNSIPKSGTHLLTGLIQQLGFTHSGLIVSASTADESPAHDSGLLVGISSPARINVDYFSSIISKIDSNSFHYGHVPYSDQLHEALEKFDLAMILLYRDPRAVALSLVNYVLRLPEHPYHDYFASCSSLDEQIKSIALGAANSFNENKPLFLPLNDWYDAVMGWVNYPKAHFLSYEDVVGEKGGGNQRTQRDTLLKLASFLDLTSNLEQVRSLQSSVFDTTSPTFHSGQIDSWQTLMNDELITYLNDHAAHALACYNKLKSIDTDLNELD